jgi:drug/metabolite transporter (DMT)-like permease
MLNVISMLFYVLVSAFGLYKIKAAGEVWSTDFAIGFTLYGVGFLIWMYILLRMPLSIAFPIAAGALIISTQLLGYFLLDERMPLQHIIGVTAIVIGITLISSRA